MFTPEQFFIETQQALGVAASIGFGALVTSSDSGINATHLPFLVRQITLLGHCARANPHVLALENGPSVMIVQGPHAYIPASLYGATDHARRTGTPGRDVPTWNYVAVHLHGTVQLVEDVNGIVSILDQSIEHFEPDYLGDWQALDGAVRRGLLNGIVGFIMNVTSIQGAAKWSQNRSASDRQRVTEYLRVQGVELPPGLTP
jgi:transcriptional regulator